MKKTTKALLFSGLLALGFTPPQKDTAFIDSNVAFARGQLKKLLTVANRQDTAFPRTVDKKGQLLSTDMYEWTSGFFPGALWYAYEATNDNELKAAAVKWTEKLSGLQYFTKHHDLGFMMYCSYGNAYRLTGNEQYKNILVQSAKSLATRFNPKTGSIRSWNLFGSWDGQGRYVYPVIIDNMMNLELLFFASKTTGDDTYRNIAIKHAENVLKNQVRPDYSCYHVVCYDTATGKVLSRETAQGYANNSTWARGQAWGIYGFTMTYRETKDKRFLETAQKMADFYLDNKALPSDKVAYWDFNANDVGYEPSRKSHAKETPVKYRDASAAAVTASALLELSSFLGENGRKYRDGGIAILHALSSPAYKAAAGENADFILKHSVGSIPHDVEIDVPLIYADYYYLEALNRYRALSGASN
ncbi:glycoside hydrolase family 88 protein [Filimonas effusa]|uniref:Glycosyl hydrolase family 88 n=1 Tax=Filimonas effusa TaxID=2508721 RepID=A0A4Q1D5W5_9BACT|nr:glycoside hydrolase family 88 protein [Filimonas effusa]RXK83895.1 glycosyl hydrolase family 88 [Filimonas effusa]